MNKIKLLSVKTQIAVLKRAKEIYVERCELKYFGGMCRCIDLALVELKNITDPNSYNHLSICIPSFSFAKLEILAVEGLIETPKNTNFYWWDEFDTEIRMKVFDVLISKLKSK